MADEQIIKLLEEVRDLQKQHFDNYKTALQHQQQSIEMQRIAVARQKLIARAVFGVIGIGFAAVFLSTGFAR